MFILKTDPETREMAQGRETLCYPVSLTRGWHLPVLVTLVN